MMTWSILLCGVGEHRVQSTVAPGVAWSICKRDFIFHGANAVEDYICSSIATTNGQGSISFTLQHQQDLSIAQQCRSVQPPTPGQ